MSQNTIKSYKIASFKEFFKRLYSEYKHQKTLKTLSPKFNLLLHKLKRIESEQTESYKEISSINCEELNEDPEFNNTKNMNNTQIKSPLSTIVEQSDQNASDTEEMKSLESLMTQALLIVDGIIPNENKTINQYKLELKNLAMEIQEMEENRENQQEKQDNESQKPQENLDFFKKLYEKENLKLSKLSKRFEVLQRNFDKMQDFISILQNEKERLLKELEKEKKISFRLQMKKDQDLKDSREKSQGFLNSDSEKKLLEKESFIQDLQKQIKCLQNNLTKSRSDLALACESRNSMDNEAKMLKNVKELLEKDNEKMSKLLEKKEKYIKEILIKVENPNINMQKIVNLEENNEGLKQEIREIQGKCEDLKAQIVDLQFLNRNLFKKEEVLDLKHRIDQLEYQNHLKSEENERIRMNNIEKINNMNYMLETDKKRIRELEESMLKIMKENKMKEEEIMELKQILENYSDLGRDLKGIKKKLFN